MLTYIQRQIDHEDAVFSTEIILDNTIFDKFNSAKTMRKLSVAIADPTLSAKITTVEAINETPPAAPVMNISLSMGHAKGGLNRKQTMKFVRSLLKWNQGKDAVRKIEAVAIGADDEHSAVLDLLKGKMTAEDTISLDANRHASYDERRKAVNRAFSRNKSELKEMYNWE